jgi:hypothetical protein
MRGSLHEEEATNSAAGSHFDTPLPAGTHAVQAPTERSNVDIAGTKSTPPVSREKPEKASAKTMNAIKRKENADAANENSDDDESEPSGKNTASVRKDDAEDTDKKGRFALQRPEDMVYETYAAPLKDIEAVLQKTIDRSKQSLPAIIETPKQSLPQMVGRLKEPEAKPAPKADLAKLKTSTLPTPVKTPAPALAKPPLPKPRTQENRPTHSRRRNLANTVKDSFTKIRRPAKKPPLPSMPAKVVAKTKPRRMLRLLLATVFLVILYILSMAPVVCYFPKQPAWLTQFYYPVAVLKQYIPWLEEYQQQWASFIRNHI